MNLNGKKANNKSFNGNDWFLHYFGFRESVKSVYENLVVTDYADHSEVFSKINQRKFNCGLFRIRTIDSFPNLQPRNNGRLHIIHGHGPKDTKKIDLIDVCMTQNHDDFEGATFLAASNFNCLELPSIDCTSAQGINGYATDSTQGPALASASISASLYRNYFVKGENNTKRGQIEYPINLLEKTPILVINGKAVINHYLIEQEFERKNPNLLKILANDINANNTELNKFNVYQKYISILEAFDFSNENSYQVAEQKTVEVTSNRGEKWHDVKDAQPNKVVNLVFASSFPFRQYVEKNEFTLKIVSFLLKAEYKAAILCAWENALMHPDHVGSNKLVLTLVGSGFFGNPMEIVTTAIAENKELIMASGLDVYVVCYSGFENVYPHLKGLIEETNGTIIET